MHNKENITLKKFLEKFNLKTEYIDDYKISFVHSSYLQVDKKTEKNERLEFLGDAVLELIVTDYLYKKYDLPEGKLSQIRAKVVSEQSLYQIAVNIGLGELLYLGKGEELNGGRTKPSILSDSLEALIGNIYLKEGFEKAYNFIIPFLIKPINDVLKKKDFSTPKTKLQELSQKYFKQLPLYNLIKETEENGQKYYTMEVIAGGEKFGPVTSYSKKLAETELAELALKYLADKLEKNKD